MKFKKSKGGKTEKIGGWGGGKSEKLSRKPEIPEKCEQYTLLTKS